MLFSNKNRSSKEEAKQIRQSLEYAKEYYNRYPEKIDFVIENSPLFYFDLSKNWKDKWYCKNCRKWLSTTIEQCKCGLWQNDYLRQKNLLRTPNKKIDDCFTLLSSNLKARSYPRLRFIGESKDNVFFALDDAMFNKDENEIARCMKQIVEKILFHLNLSLNSVSIRISVLENDDRSGIVGTYARKTHLHGEITIKVILSYHTDTCISIACHECMHHFLWQNGIWLADEKENEFLTDIAIIYCGIVGTIGVGYHEYAPKDRGNYKVGYINLEEIEYAKALYIEHREIYIREQQNALTEKIQLLENSLKYNKDLFLKSVMSEKTSAISAEALDLLAQNAAFIQYNEGTQLLLNIKGKPALNDETPESVIQNCHKNLDTCLAKLSVYNRLLITLV